VIPPATPSPFYVPPILDLVGGLVQHLMPLWLGLGRLETNLLTHELISVPLTMPVYVCGLARSGSTLLHEVLASHPGVATHRIKDFPLLFTPYWWRRASANLRPTAPRERPHRDRVLITLNSPDSLEEMLWMAFFPRCHDPSVCNQLNALTRNPDFERFYRAHLRKLLLAEQARRYVAKANYHVARLSYLVRLFPDARFVIPVRSPAGHIASLARQHAWFCQGQRRHRRSLEYMRRSGHFEFGLDRRPLNLGEPAMVREVFRAWGAGEEVRGWALYWNLVYGHVAHVLATDAQVRAATIVVPFETLCETPANMLRAILDHCALPEEPRVLERFAAEIRPPDYYPSPFSQAELDLIRRETAPTASQWGY
jgi:hypothetical protein